MTLLLIFVGHKRNVNFFSESVYNGVIFNSQ